MMVNYLPTDSLDLIKKGIDDFENVLHNIDLGKIIKYSIWMRHLYIWMLHLIMRIKGSRQVIMAKSENKKTQMSAVERIVHDNNTKTPLGAKRSSWLC
jgi:hypothetical protein